MTIPPEQQEAVAFLQATSGAAPIETHISLVFLGADTAWKLRKAVRLPFLDCTALDTRRRFAFRELELNAHAAPGLYRDVVPIIRRTDGSLTFGEEGQAIDWIVRMARVPSEHFLERIALGGGLDPVLLDAIADCVAAYHLALAPAAKAEPAEAMRVAALGSVGSALEAGLPEAGVRAWLDAVMARLNMLRDWLDARGRSGFVRRAHGDLHLGNMCLWHGRPVLFDALEFDEAMATIDLGYDLGFLLMDIDHRVGRRQANRVLNRYVARTGDAALVQGLPLFLSMRAMIRSHVEAKRERTALAATYLRAAQKYLNPAPAVVVAVGGLQGTGKSTLARSLAPELGPAPGALVLRSDEIRKRQHGASPEQRLSAEAYSATADEAMLQTLVAGVEDAGASGHAIIADATFLDPLHRDRVARAALNAGLPFAGLWLDAPLSVLELRLEARANDASDATVEVLRRAYRTSHGGGDWTTIDSGDAGTALERARAIVRDRLAA